MKSPVVMIGVGELGGVFARGLLKCGHPVYPVTRDTDLDAMARDCPAPEAVLLTVGESDLQPTLEAVPAAWRDRLVLLQNELLPRDWEAHGIENPTVISVWFEKKPGQDFKVLISSPVYGPHADLVVASLATMGIPARVLDSPEQLLFELVRKNVYILTTNIAGLEAGGTVRELWNQHETLARQVADEVMDIQDWLTAQHHNREALIQGMLEAFDGDPEHNCMGRSAPGRLNRALEHADEAGLSVHKLREICSQC